LALINLAEQFAADAFFTGSTAGHHAFGRGQNVDAQSAEYARNLAARHVHPATGTRNALDVSHGRLIGGRVLEIDLDGLLSALFRQLKVDDIALFSQDAGDLSFQLGRRDIDLLMTR